MNYYFDTEFKEYYKICKDDDGNKISLPTIDLISIGIISDDNREYYALNKETDLKEIWKDDWLKENVLKPIYEEHIKIKDRNNFKFSFDVIKLVFSMYGKTKKVLCDEIKEFVYVPFEKIKDDMDLNFYAYYADYDWVVFCQLFGRMLDLPKGFPMYCRDLKQILDDKCNQDNFKDSSFGHQTWTLKTIKNHPAYPKQENEHNALDDVKWNLKLYDFLNKI